MNLFFSLATYNFLAAGAETGDIVCMKVNPFAFDEPITYMCTSDLVQKQILHARPKCKTVCILLYCSCPSGHVSMRFHAYACH